MKTVKFQERYFSWQFIFLINFIWISDVEINILSHHLEFSCDSGTKTKQIQTKSDPLAPSGLWDKEYAIWSFNSFMGVGQKTDSRHCLVSQHPHDKLICCLIIQLSHVTNSYAAWLFSILMWQKQLNSYFLKTHISHINQFVC